MKRLLLILAMLWSVAYGQSTIYLRGDTIQMVRSGGNAELVLLNATRGVTNGFLKNLGNGRTAFATVPAGDSLFGYKDIIASGQRTFNMNGSNFIYTGNGQYILNNTFTSPNAKLKVVGDNSTQHLASFGDSTQDWTFDGSGSFAIRKKHNVAIAAGASQPENTFLVVRQMDLDSGVNLNGFYAGSRFLHEYRIRQSAKLRSEGNDFAMAAVAQLQIRKAEGYSGYSTIGTQSDGSIVQAVPALEGLLQMRGSTGSSNGMRATGWWAGVASDLVKTANDTINNVAMFMTMGLNTGKVNRMVDYYAYLSGVSSNDTGYAFFAPFKSQRNLFQNVTIGSDEDGEAAGRLNHASALVDIMSKTKGFLFPRMNTTQRDAISSPATGLHISNTDSSGKLDYYNGSAWVGYGASSGGGSATTIYNGNGALSADRTVDGDANDLFFTDMEAYRIYGTGGTYGSVRLFETSGGAGTVTVGRSTGPYTTWSDSIYHITLGQKIDTTVLKVVTINPSTGALSYSPWMYAGGGGGTPGGSDTYMQYNDAGVFGGDAGATYNETTNTLTLTGSINLPSSTSEGIKRAGTVILYDNGTTGRWSPGGGNGQLFTSGSTGIFSVFNSGGSNSVVLDGTGLIYRSSSPLQIQTTGNLGIGSGVGTSATARLHVSAGTATASTAPLKFSPGTLLTVIEAFAKEANANGTYQSSNALNRFAEGGYIKDFYTEVNNVTTTETDLYSYTTKANTFAADGEKLVAEFTGLTTGHATATRTWQVYFGGASISNSSSFFTGIDASGLEWKIRVTGVRRSSTSIVWTTEYIMGSTGVTSVVDLAIQTGLTLSGTNVFKLTGQAGGTGAGSDQIKAQYGIISWYGQANN